MARRVGNETLTRETLIRELKEMGELGVAKEVEEWTDHEGKYRGIDEWFQRKYPDLDRKIREKLNAKQ